jgi:hypothetical protein
MPPTNGPHQRRGGRTEAALFDGAAGAPSPARLGDPISHASCRRSLAGVRAEDGATAPMTTRSQPRAARRRLAAPQGAMGREHSLLLHTGPQAPEEGVVRSPAASIPAGGEIRHGSRASRLHEQLKLIHGAPSEFALKKIGCLRQKPASTYLCVTLPRTPAPARLC